MRFVVAFLALVVAVQYVVIALFVVPRLTRLTTHGGRAISAARWGAAAFFLGCAATHTGIAVLQLTADPMMDHGGSPTADFVVHVVPHIAQVIGGALFILIVRQRLELSITSKEVAAELRALAAQFRATFERAPQGIALISASGPHAGTALQVNPALRRMVGYDEATLLSGDFAERLIHPGDRFHMETVQRALLEEGRTVTDLEQRFLHRDGSEIWVSIEASLMRDEAGDPLYTVTQVRDITDDRLRQEHLRFLAEHDSQTGLLNRRRFEEELDRGLATVRRHGEPAALLVVDLDQFKYVNDTYGHRTGDVLITAVATTLHNRLRETDVLGRLGGDEFGILLPHTGPDAAVAVANSLLTALHAEAHVTVAERVVRVTASIGVISITPDLLANSEQLLAEADIAMYEAKENGRDRVATLRGGAQGGARMRARLTWSQRIRDALEVDGFTLWEQPILNLASGQSDRTEVLVRMIDPVDGSPISPSTFLYIAERFGQIQAIDRWVFRKAVDLLEQRHAVGDERSLEINLSGTSLTDEALIAQITDRISHAAIDPTKLIVEITETAAVVNVELARRLASRLSDLGCRFALDDFGSGFGSFFYLKHLHFDEVKIDGEFVKDLPGSGVDRLTVESIVAIARGMGKKTVAEFVQNEPTIDLLRALEVDYAQGYHISKPIPIPELA